LRFIFKKRYLHNHLLCLTKVLKNTNLLLFNHSQIKPAFTEAGSKTVYKCYLQHGKGMAKIEKKYLNE